jgi:hypothetical protein
MVLYYAILGIFCYLMIREPDIVVGFILAAILLMGWVFGKPFQITFIYDRKKRHLVRETNWLGPLSVFHDEAAAPDRWVIEIEHCSHSEGPDYETVILLDNGGRFPISHRSNEAEILAAYVSRWEEVEVFYYESKLFGGRKQTSHRLYSMGKRELIADFSDLDGVYL